MAGEWSLAGGCFRNLVRYDSCGIADPERLVFFRQYLLARQEKRLGNTRRALAILDSIARQPLNSPELKCYLYEDLADLNKKAGNLAPAAEWKLKFVDIKDSLISDNKQRTIYNLQRRFDEREINYRMELLMQERRNLVRTIWIVSVFSAVVVIPSSSCGCVHSAAEYNPGGEECVRCKPADSKGRGSCPRRTQR